MSHSYQTISKPVETEIEISRSRFLTKLVRVENEDAARDEIAKVKAQHPKARHHCTAYVIGADARLQRSNDDGEPSGTAGAPMLDALLAAELSDVVAIVTRYFGGVLLGAGGLTRAYRSAVAEATKKADRVVRAIRTQMKVTASYQVAPQIEAEIRRQAVTIVDIEYLEEVTLTLAVAEAEKQQVEAIAAELSAGAAVIGYGSKQYVDL